MELDKSRVFDFEHRVIFAGSRGYSDYQQFCTQVTNYLKLIGVKPGNFVIITGKAKTGADNMIIQFAEENDYPWIGYDADWNNLNVPNVVIRYNRFKNPYNAIAGHNRNQEMANVGTHLCAFWDMKSTGTRDMINRALDNDIWTIIYDINEIGKFHHATKSPVSGKNAV